MSKSAPETYADVCRCTHFRPQHIDIARFYQKRHLFSNSLPHDRAAGARTLRVRAKPLSAMRPFMASTAPPFKASPRRCAAAGSPTFGSGEGRVGQAQLRAVVRVTMTAASLLASVSDTRRAWLRLARSRLGRPLHCRLCSTAASGWHSGRFHKGAATADRDPFATFPARVIVARSRPLS